MGREAMKSFLQRFKFGIEMSMQLLVVISAATVFGIIEAKWVPTGTFDSDVFGHWSWYHVGLVSLMTVSSLAMAFSHIQHLLLSRKLYVLLMCCGSVPLALMIEDLVWFIVMKQVIAYDEWTMILPGWGLNVGFTWIPLWYFAVTAFTVTMFVIARRLEKKGRDEYVRCNHLTQPEK